METSAEKEQICAGSSVYVFGGSDVAFAGRKQDGGGGNHRTKAGSVSGKCGDLAISSRIGAENDPAPSGIPTGPGAQAASSVAFAFSQASCAAFKRNAARSARDGEA